VDQVVEARDLSNVALQLKHSQSRLKLRDGTPEDMSKIIGQERLVRKPRDDRLLVRIERQQLGQAELRLPLRRRP
jgi:hypothetical protein